MRDSWIEVIRAGGMGAWAVVTVFVFLAGRSMVSIGTLQDEKLTRFTGLAMMAVSVVSAGGFLVVLSP